MNKKGITLVEIIISIGLVSVVMIFLFNLLVDMNYEEVHASFSKINQLSRASIIQTIQNDFKDYHLTDAIKSGTGENIDIILTYQPADGPVTSKVLKVTPKQINYNNEEVWNMEDENAWYDTAKINVSKSPVDVNSLVCSEIRNSNLDISETVCTKYQYIKIVIPVSTSEKENTLDDLELFFIRKIV